MKYIDISNHQRALTRDDISKLIAAGIGGVVVGMQYPTPQAQARYGVGPGNAHRNFEVLEADGRLEIAGYFESTPPEWAWPLCSRYAYLMQWIGVGIETGGYETEADIDPVIAFIQSVQKQPVIYSSAYMWDALGLQGITKYAGFPLWNAHYDGMADGFDLPRPFGGWTRCFADQFTERGRIPGIEFEVDLNDVNTDANPRERRAAVFRTLPMDFHETIAFFRGLSANAAALVIDQGATVELDVTEGNPPDRDVYRVELPRGAGRQ